MKTISKYLLLLATFVLCTGFAACGGDDDDEDSAARDAAGQNLTLAQQLPGMWISEGDTFDDGGTVFLETGQGYKFEFDNGKIHTSFFRYILEPESGHVSINYDDGDKEGFTIKSIYTSGGTMYVQIVWDNDDPTLDTRVQTWYKLEQDKPTGK